MTIVEIKEWARQVSYETPEQMSRLIFKDVLPNFGGETPIRFGPSKEKEDLYEIEAFGEVVTVTR